MGAKNEERFERALVALDGLSVGDSFGENFFWLQPAMALYLLESRAMPNPVWKYTDDTNMAMSIVSVLRQFDEIQQDHLAASFAEHFRLSRGYGGGAAQLLMQIGQGAEWSAEAPQMFEGSGSFGNGAAMRVAPLGVYFADDMEALVENAERSSVITHAHPEGIVGGIATAVAAGLAWQAKAAGKRPTRHEFIEQAIPYVPASQVRARLETALNLPDDASLELVVKKLGNGRHISAQDTVAFVLWMAGRHLDNYEEAIWRTARAGGDVDTTCAMVGGIVSSYTGREGIPAEWLASRETLPDWFMTEEYS